MSYADLNLGNILLSNSNDLDVKITDFGLAVEGSRARGYVETYDYKAPEIMMSPKQGYTVAVDCWSLYNPPGAPLETYIVGRAALVGCQFKTHFLFFD